MSPIFDFTMAARRLRLPHFRIMLLASLGGALEFYDFIIFVFFAAVIGRLFFPTGMSDWLSTIQTFGIFGVGYVARPLGGVVLAHFGDLFGRKRIFVFSILVMTLSTMGIALLPTYSSIGVAAPILLVLMRVLQGAAIGGEVPGAWTFVAEHVPSHRVGFACGLICSGLTLGILLGSSIAALTNSLFVPDEVAAYAWRIPFLIGGIFGAIAVYLRRELQETPIFWELKRNRLLMPELPLRAVLRDYSTGVVISVLLTWVLSAGIVVTTLMTATFLENLYGYTAQQSLIATSVGSMSLIVGCVIAGAIIDRVGMGIFFMVGSFLFGISTFTFYSYAAVSPSALLILYAIMCFFVAIMAAVPYVMVRAFPARVRFTGVSFSYNLSYALFGGLSPVLITSLLQLNPMAHAYYLVFIASLSFAIGLYLYRNDAAIKSPAGVEEVTTLAPPG